MEDLSKDPRTPANDLAKLGNVVSKKEDNHFNPAQEWTSKKNSTYAGETPYTYSTTYARDNLEKHYEYQKCVLRSDEMRLERFGHREATYVWRPSKQHHLHSETWWREDYAVRLLQCIWNWESCQSGRNHKEFERNLKQQQNDLSHHVVYHENGYTADW